MRYILINEQLAIDLGIIEEKHYYRTSEKKVIFKEDHEDEFSSKSNKELFIMTIPTIFLLFAVIFGPFVNQIAGMPLISPLV